MFVSPFTFTLPETNSSKMDGWNTLVSFRGPAYFQVYTDQIKDRQTPNHGKSPGYGTISY